MVTFVFNDYWVKGRKKISDFGQILVDFYLEDILSCIFLLISYFEAIKS